MLSNIFTSKSKERLSNSNYQFDLSYWPTVKKQKLLNRAEEQATMKTTPIKQTHSEEEFRVPLKQIFILEYLVQDISLYTQNDDGHWRINRLAHSKSCHTITFNFEQILWVTAPIHPHPYSSSIHIYPTPPLGQDMTQGQLLSEV